MESTKSKGQVAAAELGQSLDGTHGSDSLGALRSLQARIGWGTALLAALVALGVVTAGCGHHEDSTAVSDAGATVVASQTDDAIDPSSGASQEKPLLSGEGYAGSVSADSLPPEVAASGPDSLVVPGGVVEITAEGSADVVSMTLTDGFGRKQPFVYDATDKVWRVFYRVPLKIATEPIGLSVTAKNGFEKWRRVWVFLRTQPEDAY